MYIPIGRECMQALHTFSYLNFCRIDFPLYYTTIKSLLSTLVPSDDSTDNNANFFSYSFWTSTSQPQPQLQQQPQQQQQQTEAAVPIVTHAETEKTKEEEEVAKKHEKSHTTAHPVHDQTRNLVDIFRLIPKEYLTNTQKHTIKEDYVEDEVTLSRVYFLLGILEKIVAKIPAGVARDEIIPLLFL